MEFHFLKHRKLYLSKTLTAGLLALAGVWAAGCNNNVKVKATNGRKAAVPEVTTIPAKGEPIEIPGTLLNGQKSYFQTRSVITLNLKNDSLVQGEEFSLLNDTTGAKLIEKQTVNLGLSEEDNPSFYSLTTGASYEVFVKLYPRSPTFKNQFAYGGNKLRLLVASDRNPRFSTDSVTLKDFRVFGVATSSFSEDGAGQRVGGFEGRVAQWQSPVVSNGAKSYLTTGSINLLNR